MLFPNFLALNCKETLKMLFFFFFLSMSLSVFCFTQIHKNNFVFKKCLENSSYYYFFLFKKGLILIVESSEANVIKTQIIAFTQRLLALPYAL